MDTYSPPAPTQDLWGWLEAFAARHDDGLPVVITAWHPLFLPQVRAPIEPPPDPEGPGRPRRDWDRALEIALAWDIEGLRPTPANQWSVPGERQSGGVSDGSLYLRVAVSQRTYPDDWDSRTHRRWRDDGRLTWAEWGAWPWALTPNGKLPRNWWGRPEYAEALRH